jgi:hypothetical protein
MATRNWKEIFANNPQLDETKKEWFERIAKQEKVKWDYVRKTHYRPRYKKTYTPAEKTPLEKIQEDLRVRSLNSKVNEYKNKYDALLKAYQESEQRFEVLIGIKEKVEIKYIEPINSNATHEAVPIIQLSDWHFEERVDDFTINGLNEYNLDIATKRWNACIQNSLKLIKKENNTSEIKQAVIWLGGDFITGYIHEELEETNYLSPTQATRFAKEKIITALKFYKQHSKLDKITVVCNYGNHGRTNKKPRVSSSYKNSYEWMMYKDIEDYFNSDKLFSFVVPDGLFAYVNIMGFSCRFWHGDTIQYGGGIGGLTVPLIKAISRYNQQIKADYNFMGHFHQLFQATKDCIVNGSGIGFNAYAQRIGASPEEPMQGFCLLDKKYGLTIKTPIFCK